MPCDCPTVHDNCSRLPTQSCRDIWETDTSPSVAARLLRPDGNTVTAPTSTFFFQDPVWHRRIYRSPDRFRKAVESIDGFRAFRFAIDGGEISFKDRSGSVSWIHSIAVTAIPVSSQVAEGTTISLETSAEILAKKLHYRLVAAHQHLPRDIYDLAWAARFDPESCAEAIATLNSDARNSLRFSLGLLPKDWMARQLRWPLIVPADKRLCSDAVAIVLDALGRHV